MVHKFKSLIELLDYFKEENTCFKYLEAQIWEHSIPVCPHCESTKVYITKPRSRLRILNGIPEYKCGNKGCEKCFTVTVGTIFEATKIPLRTWFGAIYLITTAKKGISSVQLSIQLQITQKSAWFLLHRIREMYKQTAPEKLTGTVEIDESYFGGKESNKHQNKRRNKKITGAKGKTPVVGFLERNRSVVLRVIEPDTATAKVLQPLVKEIVSTGAVIITDGNGAYRGLENDFKTHGVVSHDKGEYVRGISHTNSIENFWSIFKRGYIGIYHYMSPKHLQRYADEFGYRYNYRKLDINSRFQQVVSGSNKKRLTYQELIRKA